MFRVRRLRTRPSPEHSGQGSGITVPNPWQAAQGLEVITWPRNDRATRWTTPCPPQTSQVRGDVPGLQQVPWQVGQRTAVSTATSRWVPKAASDRSISSRTRASWPRRGTGAEERLEDVLEAEAGTEPATVGRGRVDAAVVHLALLGVREHLVGPRDLLEALLGAVTLRDVGMVLTGHPPVGALDLLGAGIAVDTEDAVVVSAHECSRRLTGFGFGGGGVRRLLTRRGSATGSGRQRGPRRSSRRSPSGWVPRSRLLGTHPDGLRRDDRLGPRCRPLPVADPRRVSSRRTPPPPNPNPVSLREHS